MGAITGLISSVVGAAASAALAKRAQNDKNKQEEKMDLLHTTKPGFDNFSEDLVDEDENDHFGLNRRIRPVVFPSAVKRPSNKFSL